MAEGFPARGVAIIDALVAKYPALVQGSDDDRRRLTLFIAEQMCFELGDKWGTKSADRTRPPSKDGLAHLRDDGTIDIWDWQNGTTRARQVRAGDAPTVAASTQVFIRVAWTDHLGPPSPPAGPPPPLPDDRAEGFADLIDAAAERIVDALSELTIAIDRLHDRAGEIQRDGVPLRWR